jgi:hypothetical protein
MAQNALVNLIIKAKDEASAVLRRIIASLREQGETLGGVTAQTDAAAQAEADLLQNTEQQADQFAESAEAATQSAEAQASVAAESTQLAGAAQEVTLAEVAKADATNLSRSAIEAEALALVQAADAAGEAATAQSAAAEGATALAATSEGIAAAETAKAEAAAQSTAAFESEAVAAEGLADASGDVATAGEAVSAASGDIATEAAQAARSSEGLAGALADEAQAASDAAGSTANVVDAQGEIAASAGQAAKGASALAGSLTDEQRAAQAAAEATGGANSEFRKAYLAEQQAVSATKALEQALTQLDQDIKLATAHFRSGRITAEDFATALQHARQSALSLSGTNTLTGRSLNQFNSILKQTAGVADGAASATIRTGTASAGASRHIGTLRSAFVQLGAGLAGVRGGVGALANALLAFGVGGAISAAVAAGIAAIAFAYDKITESARKAKEEVEKLQEALSRRSADRTPPIVQAQNDLNKLLRRREQVQAQIDALNDKQQRVQVANPITVLAVERLHKKAIEERFQLDVSIAEQERVLAEAREERQRELAEKELDRTQKIRAATFQRAAALAHAIESGQRDNATVTEAVQLAKALAVESRDVTKSQEDRNAAGEASLRVFRTLSTISREALQEEIALLAQRVERGEETAQDQTRIAELEDQITAKLAKGNLSRKDQLDLQRDLTGLHGLQEKVVDREIGQLDERAKAARLSLADSERVKQLETDIAAAIESGTLALDDRIRKQDQLNRLKQIELDLSRRNVGENIPGSAKLARANQVPGAGTPNLGDSNLNRTGKTNVEGELLVHDKQLGSGGGNATQGEGGSRPEGIGGLPKEVKEAKEKTDEFAQSLRDAVAGPLAEFFEAGIEGFESFGDAVGKFASTVIKAIGRIAAQLIAQQIVGAFLGAAGFKVSATGAGATGAKDGAFVMGGRLVAPRRFKDGGMADDPPHKRRYAHAMSYGPQRYAAGGVVTPAPGVRESGGVLLRAIGAHVLRLKDGGLVERSRSTTRELQTHDVRRYAIGGMVQGPGGPRDDMVPALLSNGEAVLNARAVNAIGGRPAIDYLNSLVSPLTRFAEGGMVSVAHVGDARDVTASVEGAIEVGLAEGLVAREIKKRSGRDALFTVMGEEKRRVDALLERRVGR